MTEAIGSIRVERTALDEAAQTALVADILDALDAAPAFQPTMPVTGTPFSVRMSNCGPLGWVSDRGGYRYQPHHPETGRPWPAFPSALLDLWYRCLPAAPTPEACLINLYGPTARMGLHQDRNEDALDVPVLSVSLGRAATFRIGGRQRSDPTVSTRLRSGDVCVLEGAGRLAFHGIDRILRDGPELVTLDKRLDGVARINLTLRRVTRAVADERSR